MSDSRGAALADVIGQAESASLPEKIRTIVTDSRGQYRIAGLRPGLYAVTVTRNGFRPFLRKRIGIAGAVTVTVIVDARLLPGAISEAVTVTATPPAVDVRSAAAAITTDHAFVAGAAWPRAKTTLTPRFFRITLETDF